MFSKLLVLSTVFAGLISAQSIPSCATPCLSNLPANCNGDPKCICQSQSFIASITCCVIDHCPNPSDIEATRNYALMICKPAGVTNLPSGNPQSCSSTAGGSGSGSSTPTPVPASTGSSASSMSMSSASGSTTPSSNPGGPMSSGTDMPSSASMSSAASSTASAATSDTTNLATETGGSAESATTAGNAPSATGAAVAPSVFLQGLGLVGLAGAALAVL